MKRQLIIGLMLIASTAFGVDLLRVYQTDIGNVEVRRDEIPDELAPDENEIVLGQYQIQGVTFYNRLSGKYALPECDPKYYVWVAPNVVEATPEQKIAIDAALAVKEDVKETQEADVDLWDDKSRALAKDHFEQINILLKNASLKERTWDEFKTSIKSKLTATSVSL